MVKKTNKLFLLPVLLLLVAYGDILLTLMQREISTDFIVTDVILILWGAIYLLVPAQHHSRTAMNINGILFVLAILLKISIVLMLGALEYNFSHDEPRRIPTMMAALPLFYNWIL